MRNTVERRLRLLEILCKRKRETLDNLAYELKVSKRTIRYDIEILSYTYPIYTTTGPYGGIYIEDTFRLGMKYLTENQCERLKCLFQTKDKRI